MLLHEYLTKAASVFPEKVALKCGEFSYTYGMLDKSAKALCVFLLEHGLEKGDRVAIYLENSMESVVSVFGTLMAGGCFVSVGLVTPMERLGYLLEHSGAKFLIAPASRSAGIVEQSARCTRPPAMVFVGGDDHGTTSLGFDEITTTKTALPQLANPGPQIVDMDLAAIIYTSGTTGKPKGVTHTHRSIGCAVETIVQYLGNSADDVILCVLQLNFSYGLVQLLATIFTGATLILEKGYGYPYEILRLIERHQVTGFAGTPTIWSLILNLPSLSSHGSVGVSEPKASAAFSSLRYITNAAAGLPESFIPRLRAIMQGTRIYLMHGQTECVRTTYLPPEEIRERPTSVGRGMRNVELWIADQDGNRLGPGEIGDMVVRGSNVMAGYWNDPEASAKVLLPGRYPWERVLHTGDLFRMDVDGYFHFVSRSDEIIKCRGEKVSPFEVERVIYQLEDVAECRVMGVPDEILGQALCAEVVMKPGKGLDERKMKAHCAKYLEAYKIPGSFALVESIPKTAGGKIRRVQPGAVDTMAHAGAPSVDYVKAKKTK